VNDQFGEDGSHNFLAVGVGVSEFLGAGDVMSADDLDYPVEKL